MAVDMFLTLTDIKGESVDVNHKDEIIVLAFSWGMSQSGTTHTATGGGAGKANFQDLTFTHYVDKATVDLWKFCTTGEHIDDGTLTVRKAGGEQALEYYVLKMKEIIVTSISTGGSGGEDQQTETVSLNFAWFDLTYQQQKRTGAGDPAPNFIWNIPATGEAEPA